MRINTLLLAIFLSIMTLIAGCSKDIPPGDYDSSEVGKIKKVVPGVIISMRPVRLHNKEAEIGITPGSRTALPASSYSDPTMNRSHGFEYVIKLNSGSIISVVQADTVKLKVKQHILVIYGRNTRVVPDHGSDDY